MYRITPEIGCLVTGREGDGRTWIFQLRQESYKFMRKNGYQIPIDVLALRSADLV